MLRPTAGSIRTNLQIEAASIRNQITNLLRLESFDPRICEHVTSPKFARVLQIAFATLSDVEYAMEYTFHIGCACTLVDSSERHNSCATGCFVFVYNPQNISELGLFADAEGRKDLFQNIFELGGTSQFVHSIQSAIEVQQNHLVGNPSFGGTSGRLQ